MTVAAAQTREALVEVTGLNVLAQGDDREIPLVVDASFSVAPGEAVAIVGESGSGKSMTARSLVGLLPPRVRAEGHAAFGDDDLLSLSKARMRRLRGSEISLLLQDPHTILNPLAHVGDQIIDGLSLAHPDWSKAQMRADVIGRLAEVGIVDETVVDRHVFQLSGGMKQRVAIAAALARDPRLLIADEPTSALDVVTQRAVLAKLRQVQQERGMSLILVTHDLRIAFSTCDRVLVFYAGRIVEVGGAAAIDGSPAHPYSVGLIGAEPEVDRRVKTIGIPGSVPRAHDVLHECPFRARCKWATKVCEEPPPLLDVAPGHQTACVRYPEIRDELAAAHRQAQLADEHPPLVRGDDDQPIVRTVDAHKAFSQRRLFRAQADVVALESVSIEVMPGESVGLVGESGSGKTTIARCLMGLETLTSGTAEIAGIDVSNPSALSRADRRAWRERAQLVFQDPNSSLNPARTVGWSLKDALAARSEAPRGSRDAEVTELLRLVGLPAFYAGRQPKALSGGERQRVAIARALAVKPRLLICDEPVSALDVSVQAEILSLFRTLQKDLGIAYLFITHDLAVLRQVAERAYIMYNGSVVEEGSIDRLLERPEHEYTQRLIAATPRPDHGWLRVGE